MGLPGWPFIVQLLSHVRYFVTPRTAAGQAFLSLPVSQSLFIFMSIEFVMPSNHLILCCPLLSCPQSFPASGSFPMSQLFASGGQIKRGTKDIRVAGSTPGSERCPGGRGGNPLQYSCLENPMAGYSPWGHRQSDTSEVN